MKKIGILFCMLIAFVLFSANVSYGNSGKAPPGMVQTVDQLASQVDIVYISNFEIPGAWCQVEQSSIGGIEFPPGVMIRSINMNAPSSVMKIKNVNGLGDRYTSQIMNVNMAIQFRNTDITRVQSCMNRYVLN